MTSTINLIPVSFTGWEKRGSIPRWAHGLNAQRKTISEVYKAESNPGVIVIKALNPKGLKQQRSQVCELGEKLSNIHHPYKLVVNFSSVKIPKPESLVEVLHLFPRDVNPHIEFCLGKETLEQCLVEALAKFSVYEKQFGEDPLAKSKKIVKVSRKLLAESGRLSAKSVAKEFGVSLTRLAEQISRTKQSLSKTPDSPRIQSLLRPYERIHRLRSVFSANDFRAWLGRANPEFDGHSPMNLLDTGQAEVVFELVDDMLLGAPS